ncbi:fimbrial protein [Pseudomonas cremoricolorata]|uniref:Fimbrial protein n=1 Tax=Pseudomonas cremoricolorata TaxID=157783 RepID=A0A089WY82_9PSED|nr:fimbrial protein [Pseudomonas cremoricolorata]AIR91602.1 fimbrial protein [Pseudomonas cremoricolorata]
MTRLCRRRVRPTANLISLLMLLLASTVVQAECRWWPGKPTYMTFQRDMGSFWVARNAPVGTVFGKASLYSANVEGSELTCFYSATDPVTARLPNSAPIFAGYIPPIDGKPVDGRILQTNVPGVGVYINLGYPYEGTATNNFTPDDGTAIPYTGVMTQNTAIGMPLEHMFGELSFVKIGEIAAGPQRVQGEMFHGIYHTVGKAMDYSISATINRAQCSVLGNPVSADPVQLGDHKTDEFTHVGATTADVPFHITLSDCADDSTPGATRANVHVYLEGGVNGSTPIDASQGLFSLSSSSTASGLGIQILRSDGTPIPLLSHERVTSIELGTTRLDFRARYYQTDAKVTPGVAEGALKFTVTYR